MTEALSVGVELARDHDANIIVGSVSMSGPIAVARNPEEFAAKLDQFALEKSEELKKATGTKVMLSHDPTIDIDNVLQKASSELSAYLVYGSARAKRARICFTGWLSGLTFRPIRYGD